MAAASEGRASGPRRVGPTLMRMAGGAVVGAAAAAGGMALADANAFDLLDGRWSFTLALWMGLTLLVIGLSLVALSFRGRFASAVMPGIEGLSVAGLGRAAFMRVQGAVLLLSGACLLIPPIYAAAPAPSAEAASGVFAAIVLLLATQSWLNWRVWRGVDELMRSVTVEAGFASFWLLQSALFLWAAAEVLGLAPALSSWDHLSILMLVYLGVSIAMSMRLGLHKEPTE